MTNIAMENPQNKWRLMSLGKSSISMDHGFHGYVSHNQMVSWESMGFYGGNEHLDLGGDMYEHLGVNFHVLS